MLVAINDFVADAFGVTSTESENELGEIKTEDFTLLIKIGPQALLVAGYGHSSRDTETSAGVAKDTSSVLSTVAHLRR